MTHLNTQEVAEILKAAGTEVTTTEQVAELAKNKIFVGAFRDADGKGKWQIPSGEVSRFIEYSQGKKKKRRTKWFTMGFVGFLISVFGLLSITKDTLDLAVSYVIPTPTPTPLICTVQDPLGEDSGPGIALRKSPMTFGGEVIASLPHGTKIEVLAIVAGDMTSYYQISSYYYDDGPILITGINPDSPAEQVGLQVGDILLKIGDESSQNRNVLYDYVIKNAGENVTLLVQRDQERITLDVIPRISPPEGEGAIGFSWQGGIIEGGEGYFPVMAASCPSE